MRAHWPALILLALVVILAVTVSILLRGEGQKAPVESLPSDTSFVARAPDVPKLLGDISRRGPPTGSAESGWNLLADVVEEALRESRVSASPSSSDLMRLLTGEAVLAFIPGQSNETREPALVVEVGPGSDRTQILAREYTASLPDTLGGVWTSRTHRGREYSVWRSSREATPICLTGLRGLVLITTSGSAMRRMLDTLDGREDSLESNATYKTVMKRLDDGAELLAYASGDWLRPRLDRLFAEHAFRRHAKTASWLGVPAVRAAGLEVSITRSRFEERLFVAMAAEGRGLLGELFTDEPRAVRLSNHVPAALPFYLSLDVSDPGAVYRRFPALLGDSSCGGAHQLRQRLDGLEQLLALDLERDLFAALGGDVAIGFGDEAPAPQMSLDHSVRYDRAVADVSIRDRGKVAEILRRADGLARLLGALSIDHRDDAGVTHYEIDSLAPMRPSYRLAKDHLLLSTDPALLTRRHILPGAGTSYADSEDIAAVVKRLPGKAHVFFCAQTTRLIGSLFVEERQNPQPRGIPEILAEYLLQSGGLDFSQPSAMALRMGPRGVLVEFTSPFSPSLLGCLAMREPATPPSGEAETIEVGTGD